MSRICFFSIACLLILGSVWSEVITSKPEAMAAKSYDSEIIARMRRLRSEPVNVKLIECLPARLAQIVTERPVHIRPHLYPHRLFNKIPNRVAEGLNKK